MGPCALNPFLPNLFFVYKFLSMGLPRRIKTWPPSSTAMAFTPCEWNILIVFGWPIFWETNSLKLLNYLFQQLLFCTTLGRLPPGLVHWETVNNSGREQLLWWGWGVPEVQEGPGNHRLLRQNEGGSKDRWVTSSHRFIYKRKKKVFKLWWALYNYVNNKYYATPLVERILLLLEQHFGPPLSWKFYRGKTSAEKVFLQVNLSHLDS